MSGTGTIRLSAAVAATLAFTPMAGVVANRSEEVACFAAPSSRWEQGHVTIRPGAIAFGTLPDLIGEITGSADIIESSRGVEIMKTVAYMRQLIDGWMGANSLAPTSSAIDELVIASDALHPDARVAPAADGSIIIEWESANREYLVSIEHDNTLVYVEEDAEGNLLSEREEPYSIMALRRALTAGTAA